MGPGTSPEFVELADAHVGSPDGDGRMTERRQGEGVDVPLDEEYLPADRPRNEQRLVAAHEVLGLLELVLWLAPQPARDEALDAPPVPERDRCGAPVRAEQEPSPRAFVEPPSLPPLGHVGVLREGGVGPLCFPE